MPSSPSQQKNKNLQEYLRFAVTGGLNTAIDFGVFNALLFAAGGAVSHTTYVVFKGISFCAAVSNSYVLNKRWVFAHAATTKNPKEKILFFSMSAVGFVLNTISALIVFSLIESAFPAFNKALAANIGAVAGAIITKVWNFLSYKFIVFKSPTPHTIKA